MADTTSRPWWVGTLAAGIAIGIAYNNPHGAGRLVGGAVDAAVTVITTAANVLPDDATTTDTGNPIPSPTEVLP
jgi:hypothetical protein